MVADQLIPRGIADPRILDAMGAVPREAFIPPEFFLHAYDDGPLPIGGGQTISQPYIVALMTQAAKLKPTDRVLEIGTGSGYQAAVLSLLVSEVYSIERIETLAFEAQRALADWGCKNVTVMTGDGSIGWAEQGPFDAILVTASAPRIPPSLIEQLSPGGRLIIPIGDFAGQHLIRFTQGDGEEILEAVRFVPLLGKEGF